MISIAATSHVQYHFFFVQPSTNILRVLTPLVRLLRKMSMNIMTNNNEHKLLFLSDEHDDLASVSNFRRVAPTTGKEDLFTPCQICLVVGVCSLH